MPSRKMNVLKSDEFSLKYSVASQLWNEWPYKEVGAGYYSKWVCLEGRAGALVVLVFFGQLQLHLLVVRVPLVRSEDGEVVFELVLVTRSDVTLIQYLLHLHTPKMKRQRIKPVGLKQLLIFWIIIKLGRGFWRNRWKLTMFADVKAPIAWPRKNTVLI